METPELLAQLMERARLVLQLARLPVVRLRFEQRPDPEGIRHAHALFTRPHPRYKVFRNKTGGVSAVSGALRAGAGLVQAGPAPQKAPT